MQLPHLFNKPPITKPVFFFAIHLSDGVVQSALWKVDQGMIEVVSRSGQKNWQDDETCVTAIDQSLQELSKESENVKETLFALSPEWVTPEGILPSKKPLFQKITKELSLEAIGFVVTTEALLQHFTQTLSPQLSLFLIEVAAAQLFITQVKQGSLLQTEKVGRSGDTVSDLIEGFAHFKDKVFPSKFLLYSSVLTEAELEEIRQTLFSHDWPSEYPFLHPPVIDIFAPDHVLEIIIQTGGRAVAESKGLSLVSLPEVKGVADSDANLLVPNPTDSAEIVKPVTATTAPLIGGGAGSLTAIEEASDDFAAVALDKAHPIENETAVDLPKDTVSKAEETNLQAVNKQEIEFGSTSTESSTEADKLESAAESDTDETDSHTKKSRFALPAQLSMKHFLPFLGVGIVVGLLFLWGIGWVAASQLKQATVTLQLDTQPVNKDVTLTLDPTAAASDPTQLLLKASEVSKEEQGTKTAQSTGSKIIGDNAKGSITIYNRTSNPETFTAGTPINSDTQKFTLDSDTTVASASSGTDLTVINVGTANATITAVAIGTDSNIPKDTDLTIGSFSKDSYFARTTSDITGGTSREILAVSDSDQAQLKASLLTDLTTQAAADFKTDSTGGQYIVPTNEVKIEKATFSDDVGQEADTFSLSMQIQASGLSYQIADLKPLATQLLSTDLTQGYTVNQDDIQVLSNPVLASTASAQVKLQANISSVATPTIDTDQLKQQLAGKSQAAAEALVKQNSGVKNVTIQETPAILKIFSSALPGNVHKITVKVTQ